MIIFSPPFPEMLRLTHDPQIFTKGVWVLNVFHNLVNKSCNTRRIALVLGYKCNDKGGPFFKNSIEVKSRDLAIDSIEVTYPHSKD